MEKRHKLAQLDLNKEEWTCVRLLYNVLQVHMYSAPKNCSSVLDVFVGLHVSSEPWHLWACA